MKKQIKQFAAAAVLVLNLFSFTACSSATASSTSSSKALPQVSSTASSQGASGGQTVIYGKVTLVSGEKVTMSLGTLKQSGNIRNNDPQGTPPGNGNGSNNSAPGGGKGPGTSSGGTAGQGNPPDGTKGSAPDMLTLTGETKTITISDTSILKKQNRGMNGSPNAKGSSGSDTQSGGSNSDSSATAASMTDITLGSVLKVTYETNSQKLVSVEIIRGA